jgi:oxygen-dependent protoporphyrinogen oxidase
MTGRHVVIAGGGLAGLVAARCLAERGIRTTVLEQRSRLGGQVHTVLEGGFVVDQGAEGYVPRSRAVAALCEELGLGDQVIPQREQDALLLGPGGLSRLPPGTAARLLGIPVEAEDLGQGLHSLRRGMGDLVAALARSLDGRAAIRLSARVHRLTRLADHWQVELELPVV